MFNWIKNHFSKATPPKNGICVPKLDITQIRVKNQMSRIYLPNRCYDRITDTIDLEEIHSYIRKLELDNSRLHFGLCENNNCHKAELYCLGIKREESETISYMERRELNQLKSIVFSVLGNYDDLAYDYFGEKEFNEKLSHIIEEYYSFDELKNNYNNKILEKNQKIIELTEENETLNKYLDKASSYVNSYLELKSHSEDIAEKSSEHDSLLEEKTNKINELTHILAEKSSEIMVLKNQNKNSLKPSDESSLSRSSPQVLKWKQKVLKRDKICQCCGNDNNLQVHHLSAFVTHNERGADMDNGIVLCKKCHKQYHSKYGINGITNNPVTLAKFLRENGIQLQSRLESFNEDSNIFSEIMEGK